MTMENITSTIISNFTEAIFNGNGTTPNLTIGEIVQAPEQEFRGDTRPHPTAEELKEIMYLYYCINGILLSVICSIGIVSNILNIIALSLAVRKKNFVTYKLFLLMAVADLVTMTIFLSYCAGFMTAQPIVFVYDYDNLDVPYIHYFWFWMYHRFLNVSATISNWTAVLIGLFRLLAVTFPLKAHVLTSNTRVHLSMFAVIIGSLLVQIPSWIQTKIRENGEVEYEEKKAGWLAIFTVAFSDPLPIFLCFIITILLITVLSTNHKKMKGSLRKEQATERSKEQRQITLTLILVSSFYVIMNTTSIAYWIIAEGLFWERLHLSRYAQTIFYFVALVLVMTGYACNFFIYIVANASFRRDLISLLPFIKSKKSKPKPASQSLSNKVSNSSTKQTLVSSSSSNGPAT